MRAIKANLNILFIVIILIGVTATVGLAICCNFKINEQIRKIQTRTLSESDKANAIEFANKFFVDYKKAITGKPSYASDDTTVYYSFDAIRNTLIAERATDKFIVNYFNDYLTQTLRYSDPILCTQNSSDSSLFATNAKISGKYIEMDITHVREKHLSIKVIKESEEFKLDSLVCNK